LEMLVSTSSCFKCLPAKGQSEAMYLLFFVLICGTGQGLSCEVFGISQVFIVTNAKKKPFCHSFVNCSFKDQSSDAFSHMQEKYSATQGMCSITASCICFKLWLVYNHHHTEALEIQRAPKDLNHYLQKI